jgi:NodT family efflux transporter outer membrane factor (OMF) lipoprotein
MLPPLNQKLSQAEHLIATLEGQAPSDLAPPDIGLADLTLPAHLPKTLPSTLVRQRPDILQSEATLHAASAQIGVATAALYPSFTLSGEYGTNHTSLGKIFNQNGSFWSLGAGITAPIFHGGTLRAQKRASVDAYEAALGTYRQTVLSAFQQVADAIRALEHDADLVQAESQALNTSEEAARLLETNYRAGTANYLQVLAANAQYFQAKLGLVQAIAQRFQDTVGFYLALGGGWRSPEEAASTFQK